MNLLEEPSLQPGDNLDNLLRAYFQAEMPNPWPSLEAPPRRLRVASPRPAAKSGGSLLRSRLALAASIALLVSGPLFLAGSFPDAAAPKLGKSVDSANRVDPRGPQYHESLIQKSDGTQIRIDIFEENGSK
jgi:hypothetical protein